MRNIFKIRKKARATSLIEVLIVLLIISVTIVTSIDIVVRSSIAIKANEIEDIANSKLLEVLEGVKSSQVVFISDDSWKNGIDNTYYFNIAYQSSINYLEYIQSATSKLIENNCAAPYIVNGINFKMCLQVQIIPRTNKFTGGSNYYEINIVGTYPNSNKVQLRYLKAYRFGKFCLITEVCS